MAEERGVIEGEPPKLRPEGWVGLDVGRKVFNEGRKPMCRGKPVWVPGKELISPQPPGVTLLCPTDAPRMAPDRGPKHPSLKLY